MTNAFEPGSGGTVMAPPASAPATAVPNATAATTTGPSVSIQVDDERIDQGDEVAITVIARDARGLDWIAWEGDDTDDAELDREHRFDCNGQTECASVWTVRATEPGTHTLNASAMTVDDVRSELMPLTLRVREASATPAPTAVPTSAPTAVPTSGTGSGRVQGTGTGTGSSGTGTGNGHGTGTGTGTGPGRVPVRNRHRDAVATPDRSIL